jgi:hypothetical protein
MSISYERLLDAFAELGSVENVQMNPDDLSEDVFLLGRAFKNEDEFNSAVAATVNALKKLAMDKVTPAELERNMRGFQSYHYQHKVEQGARADMRIIFKRTDSGIEVKALGHRFIPQDIYKRLAATRAQA